MNNNELSPQNVIVTGASGQLGSEVCKKLINRNYNVIATDIKPPQQNIDKVDYYFFDARDLEKKADFYEKVKKKYGGIDILINNLGVAVFSNFEDRTEEEFDFVMDINIKSTFFEIQNFVKLFDNKKLKKASIVNIASIFGVVSPDYRNYTDLARKSSEVYGASKAAIIQLTKYFAVHLAGRNIAVNCVSPGGIYNPENPQGPDFIKNYSFRTPLNRMATVEEVTEAIMFFCCCESKYITGQNIVVDGGLTSW